MWNSTQIGHTGSLTLASSVARTAFCGIGNAKKAGNVEAECSARAAVDASKRALGERGPVWWTNGAPDFNRRMVANTPYAEWHAALVAKSTP